MMDICNKCEGPYYNGKCFCYGADEDWFASLPEEHVRIPVPDPRGYKTVVCRRDHYSSMHPASATCWVCERKEGADADRTTL